MALPVTGVPSTRAQWNPVTSLRGVDLRRISGSVILLLASAWEKVVLPPSAQPNRSLNTVAYGNGTFVTMGFEEVLTSPDGKVWTAGISDNKFTSISSLVYGNGYFVATDLATFGTCKVYRSADGTTWSQPEAMVAAGAIVTFCNGQFMIMGRDTVMTSPDGTTWTKTHTGIHATIYSIAYGAGRYVALGWKDTVLTSPDGTTWTIGALGSTLSFKSVTCRQTDPFV